LASREYVSLAVQRFYQRHFSFQAVLASDANAELYVYDPVGEPPDRVGDMIPVEFELVQNYPNPFNPATTINYRLDQAGMVNLVICDMLGRKVETLVDEMKTPGSYAVTWNGQEFASGVYFYRIKLGDSRVLTQKMMLMK